MTGLLGTLEGFVGALRSAGVPAGTSEVIDATRVLGAVDLTDRRQLHGGDQVVGRVVAKALAADERGGDRAVRGGRVPGRSRRVPRR